MALFYGLIALSHYWTAPVHAQADIQLDPAVLAEVCAFFGGAHPHGVSISLVFAIAYGQLAAHNARAERILIPAARHPAIHSRAEFSAAGDGGDGGAVSHAAVRRGIGFDSADFHRPGVEHGVQRLFLHQEHSARIAWRPRGVYRLSWWQRFSQLELPFAAIGLVWNSMMSVAGGWFFLMACEAFVLNNRDLRLPGLGSYLQTAANAGNTGAILWGLGAMIAVIVLMDQMIWRPVIAWSEKFKLEQVEAAQTPTLADSDPAAAVAPAAVLSAGKTIDPALEAVDLVFRARRRAGTSRAEGPPRSDGRCAGSRCSLLPDRIRCGAHGPDAGDAHAAPI